MGLHDTVRERLARHDLDAEEHEWAAAAAWTAGQYRESAEHWANAIAGSDAESTARRAERRAAALWLRGELRRSRKELVEALADAERDLVSPEQRLIMSETLGRVLVHMSRLPDTRFLVTRSRRLEVLHHLDRAQADVDGPLGVDLRARVASVRTALGEASYEESPRDPVRDFDQTESLLGMLNFRHAELRNRAERGATIEVNEYRRQATDFACIGDNGDAIRVPLLPGAERAFVPSSVWAGLGNVDFTRWHRLRLFVAWYGRRLLRQR
jgi:hypothetical protein